MHMDVHTATTSTGESARRRLSVSLVACIRVQPAQHQSRKGRQKAPRLPPKDLRLGRLGGGKAGGWEDTGHE